MKYALVTLDYPPEKGGVARYLGELMRASSGEIDVFVNETHPLSGPGHVRQARLLRARWPQWWPMVRFIRSLKGKGYDGAIVSHILPVGTAAWIARLAGGLPYLVFVHGLDIRLAGISRRKRWLAGKILKSAKRVIANSAFVAREAAAIAPHARLLVLTPGVATEDGMQPRDRARGVLGLDAEAQVILCVSRLVMRKGIDQLIRSLPYLDPAVRLVVLGDGTDRERLEHEAEPVRDRVRFVSRAADQERDLWYAAADVFALPVREEAGDVEGFGIVYLEAAMAGLPVLAGKSGGAVEAVTEGVTGLLVDGESVQDVTRGLRTLLDDPELRRRMGEAGRARARKDFRWEDRWKALRKNLEES